ncbi:homing endonuclease [Bacillus phage Spock]|uniref:Homing endonuclease n=2 Tax=Bequatrovirus spock TaxID=1918008 RepID=A0A1X9SFT5_9CAUD|nr:homing endonuclease [Bacillus phage Spock]AGY48404.1 hypothetical protein Spock_4 [Bacillus phage Spock]ARQ94918.1 hypothetical protein FLAPJACK_4 [Bacillus phage Flapjack]
MKKHKLGDKYTDELVIARAEEIGFSVTDIIRDDVIPFVHMECQCGAKKTSKASSMQNVKCVFCEGKKNRKEDVLAKLNNEGYALKGELEESEDQYGNKFIKSSTKMTVICEEGHERTIRVFDLFTRPECTICNGKINNSGFSRSEEIIHRFLDYHKIEHARQYKLPSEYEGLRVDFYLPRLNTIIEYDGEHHKYKRSDSTEEAFNETVRRDKVRDDYATNNSITMIRIDGAVVGKEIIYGLRMLLQDHIGFKVMNDPYYDEIVRDVLDECSEKYGWLSYDEIKESADIRKNHTQAEIALMPDRSTTVTNRHFRMIYGMTKQNYYGNF